MIDVEEYITLVIHTPERAQLLKNILESHGMQIRLEDFVSFKSPMTVAQRVKIIPKDLPLALRIIESGDNYSPALIEMKMAGMSGNMLIPVDFSESSKVAVTIGFKLARRIGVHPVVMNAYVAPLFNPAVSGDADPMLAGEDIAEAEEARNIREISSVRLSKFKRQIGEWQKQGEVPDLKFTASLLEGVPEEVILSYCKDTPPVLVVMATRGVDRKEEELIGSVTAEVLDSCRVPVFTVPEHCSIDSIEDVKRLMLFCNMDQHDIMTVDALMRMFEYPDCEVTLVPVMSRKGSRVKSKMTALCDFFNNNYPTARFSLFIPQSDDYRKGIDREISDKDIELLIVPNKRTNVFSRIFHPTIAHKFLFERDMPMLVIPV